MILQFMLSMPNVGSWNGKWTGQDNFYVLTRTFYKRETKKVNAILKESYYHYDFGDGWSAGVSVKLVDAQEAAKVRKKSQGFCGYDWMVDSIISHGKILNTKEQQEILELL